MSERKTRKLTCIITGRSLLATKEYYDRKVQNSGSEEILEKTYACKEAKDLLIKGYSVDKIRTMLNIKAPGLTEIDESIVHEIVKSKAAPYRKTSIFSVSTNLINLNTDPDVEILLKNLHEEDKKPK